MIMLDQAEERFEGLTQHGRENQNYDAFEVTFWQSY